MSSGLSDLHLTSIGIIRRQALVSHLTDCPWSWKLWNPAISEPSIFLVNLTVIDRWVKKLLEKCMHIHRVLFPKEVLKVHVVSLHEARHLEKTGLFWLE